MKRSKTGNPKYPLTVTLSTGQKITVPRQSKFDNDWLRKHGCSIMAEYMALQFLGVSHIPVHGRLVKIWPINLYEWHKKNTPDQIFAKLTVKGVAEGINKLSFGKGSAKYGPTPTEHKIQTALNAGALVIVERGDPIHTLTFIQDEGVVYKLNAGTCTKSSAEWAAKVATKSKRYRGMVIVK